MKLIKTRSLLNELITQNRENETGRPITDYTIREVKEELNEFETKYTLYFRIIRISIFIILHIMWAYYVIYYLL